MAVMISPRHKGLLKKLGLVVLAYSLLGVLIAPTLIRYAFEKEVADTLHLRGELGGISFNPLTLGLTMHGVSIRESAGSAPLVAANRIYVRMAPLDSLWIRGAAIAKLELDRPQVNAVISKNGQLNLKRLEPPASAEAPAQTRGKGPGWKIGQLAINKGAVSFVDNSRGQPFAVSLTPLSLVLENIGSQPGREGDYTFNAQTPAGESFRWHGTLALNPLRSQGHLDITRLQALTLANYLQDKLPVKAAQGTLDLGADYQFKAGDALQAAISHGKVTINTFKAVQRNGQDPLGITLGQLTLDGIDLDWPLQAAQLDTVQLRGVTIPGTQTQAASTLALGSLSMNRIHWDAPRQTLGIDQLSLGALVMHDLQGHTLLDIPALSVARVGLNTATHHLAIGNIGLAGASVNIKLQKNNQTDWNDDIADLKRRLTAGQPPAAVSVASAGSVGAAPVPWVWSLDQLKLEKCQLGAQDERYSPAINLSARDISFNIHPQQSVNAPQALDGSLQLDQGGRIALDGTIVEQPLKADMHLHLDRLNIPPLAPYFADVGKFRLDSGHLDIDGHVQFQKAPRFTASFSGGVSVGEFAANDLALDQRFLAWKQLALHDVAFQLVPLGVNVRQITVDTPYTRAVIAPDYTLNLQQIFATAPARATTPAVAVKPVAATAAVPSIPPVQIGQVVVTNGNMLFADLTLTPRFATGIQALNGKISGISTTSHKPTILMLNGRVDQFGTAQISGELDPLNGTRHSNFRVRFANLEMTNMTPYSAKFAGYRIDKGKLSLDLHYQIEQRKLQATNDVVINQLTLGEKVDSKDAVHLPLKLALAVLTDSDGNINLDLPISGSVDDPDFHVGRIIWKALVNVLTKVAEAPFRLVGSLVGGGEDMDKIAFAPGSAVLSPDQLTKVDKLGQALAKRPALHVSLRGTYDPAADLNALRQTRFNADLLEATPNAASELKALEGLYLTRSSKEELAQLRALNLRPTGPGGALELSEASYRKAMREAITQREQVSTDDLTDLASQRATAIRNQLAGADTVDATRIFLLDPQAAASQSGKVVTSAVLDAE